MHSALRWNIRIIIWKSILLRFAHCFAREKNNLFFGRLRTGWWKGYLHALFPIGQEGLLPECWGRWHCWEWWEQERRSTPLSKVVREQQFQKKGKDITYLNGVAGSPQEVPRWKRHSMLSWECSVMVWNMCMTWIPATGASTLFSSVGLQDRYREQYRFNCRKHKKVLLHWPYECV